MHMHTANAISKCITVNSQIIWQLLQCCSRFHTGLQPLPAGMSIFTEPLLTNLKTSPDVTTNQVQKNLNTTFLHVYRHLSQQRKFHRIRFLHKNVQLNIRTDNCTRITSINTVQWHRFTRRLRANCTIAIQCWTRSSRLRQLVYDNCALHYFKINSFSLELEFKPELTILSDQVLNFAFRKFTKWRFVQLITIFLELFRLTATSAVGVFAAARRAAHSS